jgi:hypothetical protein
LWLAAIAVLLSLAGVNKPLILLHYFDRLLLYAKRVWISDADTSFRWVALLDFVQNIGVLFTEIRKQLI